MSNILQITAEDSDGLLNAGAYGAGALIRVQTSATEAGTYADITGTGSTPTLALVSGIRDYIAYDPNGITSSWYRTRYENVGATRLSDWSAVFQAGAGPAMLCTIGQVKARLSPAGPTDTGDDPLLTELVIGVSDWIEHYTGRQFTPSTATYITDTRGGYDLRVPQGIRSVTSLGINSSAHQPDTGGTYTTIAAASIMLRPSEIDRPAGWPATTIRLSRATSYVFGTVENGATITGDFGFASVPPDIQAVAIDGTVSAYQMRKNGTSGVFGADANTGVPWWQFTAASMKTLNMYRDPVIG